MRRTFPQPDLFEARPPRMALTAPNSTTSRVQSRSVLAVIAPFSKWRTTADEDGHYSFAVAL
jgi:hypothetical protein